MRVGCNSLARQIGICSACTNSHDTGLCSHPPEPQSGVPYAGFSGRAINAHPYSTASSSSYGRPWTGWLQDLTSLWARYGCFNLCSTVSCDYFFFSSYLSYSLVKSLSADETSNISRHFPYNLSKYWTLLWKNTLGFVHPLGCRPSSFISVAWSTK